MRNYNKPEKLTDKDKNLLRYVENVKNNDPATMKAIAEYNPYGKKNNRSPDVYEISEHLNKFRAENDKLPTFNSALGKFELNGKSGPLSDFVKPNGELPRVDFGLGKSQSITPMQDALKNIQRKGKRAKKMDDLDLYFSAADPKEKMSMRKRYKDYDFTKRKYKSDIAKEQILKNPITKPVTAPQKHIEVPSIDVGELIKQRANDRAARDKANIIREYGDKGLGLLRLKMEGLDD
jgi:hypothetical protein